ncbi:class I SAM-dependent methyltransferase [Tenacibaculum sp. UWU-22]|uniref:class I SAM-dependent methyltransferase n=1 Tax=Tenacibaculum sp. UWU-22 TaxID=3234187 RepID=UPI0034DAE87E
MNSTILHKEVQDFINQNLKSDVNKLILKGSPFKNITIQELANQIIAKQKSEKKLPTWFATKNIYYPPKISIEQTSSEITANYKATLVKSESIVDITGGFGVDCFAFSKKNKKVVYCEINEDLSKIVSYNYQQLRVSNIKIITDNGLLFLKNTLEKFDCIYVDPSRRNQTKGKVFLLNDCEPNIPKNLDFLFTKTDTILIKSSPILDITSAINELQFVKTIYIVAVHNEVKELLFLLEKNNQKNSEIKTINILKKGSQVFDFNLNSEGVATYSAPLTYVYEPNAAILKSGGFNQVSQQLNVYKLHIHSHLYTSENLITDFPGRIFQINKVIKYNKKQLLKEIPNKKANITTRNFPKTVAQIRKETKLKEGGDIYVFFTTLIDDALVAIICQQIYS